MNSSEKFVIVVINSKVIMCFQEHPQNIGVHQHLIPACYFTNQCLFFLPVTDLRVVRPSCSYYSALKYIFESENTVASNLRSKEEHESLVELQDTNSSLHVPHYQDGNVGFGQVIPEEWKRQSTVK